MLFDNAVNKVVPDDTVGLLSLSPLIKTSQSEASITFVSTIYNKKTSE